MCNTKLWVVQWCGVGLAFSIACSNESEGNLAATDGRAPTGGATRQAGGGGAAGGVSSDSGGGPVTGGTLTGVNGSGGERAGGSGREGTAGSSGAGGRMAGEAGHGGADTACTPGQVQTGVCGACGIRARLCGATGDYDEWSGCEDEVTQPECLPGELVESPCYRCGNAALTCDPATCALDDLGCFFDSSACVAGEQEAAEGGCGEGTFSVRSCDADCGWSAWSSCQSALSLDHLDLAFFAPMDTATQRLRLVGSRGPIAPSHLSVLLTVRTGGGSAEAGWSVDGRYFGFVAISDSNRLFVNDVTGNSTQLETPLEFEGATEFRWCSARDRSTQLVYRDANSTLRWLDVAHPASGSVVIATQVEAMLFDWSPDGAQVSFRSAKHFFTVEPVAGTAPEPVLANQELQSCVWSPNGAHLACLGNEGVSVVAPRSEQALVAWRSSSGGFVLSPDDYAWRGDSEALVLRDQVGDAPELYQVRLDELGSGPIEAPAPLNSPLPDGSGIERFLVRDTRLFYSAAGGLWALDLDTPTPTGPRLLAGDVAGFETDRAWRARVSPDVWDASPDGSRVVFVADLLRPGLDELFQVDLYGMDLSPSQHLPPADPIARLPDYGLINEVRFDPSSTRVGFRMQSFRHLPDDPSNLYVVTYERNETSLPLFVQESSYHVQTFAFRP